MLNYLVFALLFETIEPAYATINAIIPQQVMASAILADDSNLTLGSPKTPVKKGNGLFPLIDAKSVFSVDLNSGSPLLVKEIFVRRQIGSISKLVTAMVILDNRQLNEKIIVSRNAASQAGSSMSLTAGEEITVENLLKGMLINSGNDAAVALAEYDAGGERAFVEKMNMKASELGLQNTHFSNSKGFDDENNYSTAFDTLAFSREALRYPFIRQTASIKKTDVFSVKGGIKHSLENTNELLENPLFKVIGLKTGKTPAAGESFVSLTQGSNNHEILTIMLDSPSRFKETKIVLDWIFRNFDFP